MSKEGTCQNCYSYGMVELHHIIKKSQASFLRDCELNFIHLCPNCHRGTFGVHGREGNKLDFKIRLDYQNKIEMLLIKEAYTKEQLKELLKINSSSIDSLCKLTQCEKGTFNREDILRTLCGGKLITENETKEIEKRCNFEPTRNIR